MKKPNHKRFLSEGNAKARLKVDRKSHWTHSAQAKRVFSLSRWLHIYISAALFSLLLFFSVTGITLNHANWTAKSQILSQSIALPKKVTTQINGEYQINAITQFIEQKTGLTNPRNVDLAFDIGEITFDFPLPAGYVFVTVFLEDQSAEIEHGNSGLLALLNDLHKGRHSGKFWANLIDISAVFISLFTLTGLIILLQNAKHRKQAIIILLFGSITPIAIYFLFVPRLL